MIYLTFEVQNSDFGLRKSDWGNSSSGLHHSARWRQFIGIHRSSSQTSSDLSPRTIAQRNSKQWPLKELQYESQQLASQSGMARLSGQPPPRYHTQNITHNPKNSATQSAAWQSGTKEDAYLRWQYYKVAKCSSVSCPPSFSSVRLVRSLVNVNSPYKRMIFGVCFVHTSEYYAHTHKAVRRYSHTQNQRQKF